MLYKALEKGQETVREFIADELPEVGRTIKANQAAYRVEGIVWAQNVDSNRVPSGCILVRPL